MSETEAPKKPRKKPLTAIEREPVAPEVSQYTQPPGTDAWFCALCGARYCFKRPVGTGMRGGPEQRMIDRRYGEYRCWRALDKRHPKGTVVVLIAEGAPNPPQPEQEEGTT
jgi:hypothetical protein